MSDPGVALIPLRRARVESKNGPSAIHECLTDPRCRDAFGGLLPTEYYVLDGPSVLRPTPASPHVMAPDEAAWFGDVQDTLRARGLTEAQSAAALKALSAALSLLSSGALLAKTGLLIRPIPDAFKFLAAGLGGGTLAVTIVTYGAGVFVVLTGVAMIALGVYLGVLLSRDIVPQLRRAR